MWWGLPQLNTVDVALIFILEIGIGSDGGEVGVDGFVLAWIYYLADIGDYLWDMDPRYILNVHKLKLA
jgi:hypothetical protein